MATTFPLLGEPLALDLVNTRICVGGEQVDLLDTPAALTSWLTAQTARVRWLGSVDDADLVAVRALREAVRALLAADRDGTNPPAGALDAVNAALRLPALALQLTWADIGPRVEPATGRTPQEELLHAIALDVVALLTGPEHQLLRTCEHPECILQFLGRNRRRRWCSAAGCGNRARVARHYSRHRTT